jgi:putative peptidoglycan lipid II flippase
VLGLVRELVIAAAFGSSAIADCVNVAFKFPNLFRRIFGEGALSVVFIPIYSRKLLNSSEDAAKFGSQVIICVSVIMGLFILLLEIFMPQAMAVIAPGFFVDNDKFDLAVLLCRITTPYMFLISITALIGGMLNSAKKFVSFAMTPILMNMVVIIGTIFSAGSVKALFVCIALIVAGVLQVIFIYYSLRKTGINLDMVHAKDLSRDNHEIKLLMKNMGPAALSSGVQQLNIFISQSIASFIPGAVSILSYADRLYQLPLSIIGVTFSTLLLPELSSLYNANEKEKANLLQNKAIRVSMLISMPAMAGLMLLAHPIVQVVYQYGAFNASDTIRTSDALVGYSFGLPAFVIGKVLTTVFYANYDTKTPFRITCYTIFINIVLNIIFMIPYGHVGIAIGSSCAAWINIILLVRYSKNHGISKIDKATKLAIIKTLFATAMMALVTFALFLYTKEIFHGDFGLLRPIITLVALIICSIIAYAVSAYMLGLLNDLPRRKKIM